MNDDENIRSLALSYLGRTLGKEQEEESKARFSELEEIKKSDLPFISKNRYLLLTPPFDPVACVGSIKANRVECATSFLEWHARKGSAVK